MKIQRLYIPLLMMLATSLSAQIKPSVQVDKNTGPRHEIKDFPIHGLSGLPLKSSRPLDFVTFDPKSIAALTPARALQQGFSVVYAEDGRPVSVTGKLDGIGSRDEAAAMAVLKATAGIMAIGDPGAEWISTKAGVETDGVVHFRFMQSSRGVPVYGGELTVHLQPEGRFLVLGRSWPSSKLEDLTPALSQAKAVEKAFADVRGHTPVRSLAIPGIGVTKAPVTDARLVIYHPEEQPAGERLAWELHIVPNLTAHWAYFIDAETGEVLRSYSELCQIDGHAHAGNPAKTAADRPESAISKELPAFLPPDGPKTATATDLKGVSRSINTYEFQGGFYLIDASRSMYSAAGSQMPNDPAGVIWTVDAQNNSPQQDNFDVIHVTSGNNSWTNKTAVSAHYNAGLAYTYYKNTFSRNSINGQGGNIISLINVTDENDLSMGNAFWDGQFMYYGNGDQSFSAPLAKADDVAGHELTHGVIQNTANLDYQGESGALNESFADIFGAMIDRDDWKMGEDVVNTAVFPTGALRDLSNPHNGGSGLSSPSWQPDKLSEKYTGSQDNGGVHINSGITNKAYYLFATAIGKDKAEQVYYEALDKYLVRSSKFIDARIAVIAAAQAKYGSSAAQAAGAAFDAVQIFGNQGGGGSYQDDLDPNVGLDYILLTNANKSLLRIIDPSGANIANPLTDLGPLSRPSITDDGTIIVYVSQNKTLEAIVIDWNTPTAQGVQLSSEPIWRNAAISKDGTHLAALTDDYDNQLWVFDLDAETYQAFELFNPTTAQGVSSGNVAYADVLEWDYSGEYVIYDALNQIPGNGFNIEYWDIGFINVWNKAANDYGNNEIGKIFSSLPENTSVGDPSLAKNSPYILVFDVLDDLTGDVYIQSVNIQTGDVGYFAQSNDQGWPNYTTDDDFILYDDVVSGSRVIKAVAVDDDKLNAAANPFTYITRNDGARWAVWFNTGERNLQVGTTDNEADNLGLALSPNPFVENLEVTFNLTQSGPVRAALFDGLGRSVWQGEWNTVSGRNRFGIGAGQLPSGAYTLRIQGDHWAASRMVVKQ
ncbi:MAG: M4 family metallopeptidase [Lewinellaceae bacterium]|nr:M4 family metallopeptidase [Lewinellaceae bacterium]